MFCHFSYCSDKEARTHDYEPDWDYDIISLNNHKYFQRTLHPVAIRLAQELAANHHPGFEVILVKKEEFGDHIGAYMDGTGSLPVIGLDPDKITEICYGKNISLKHGIESTLAHEIAHGIQDSMGLLEEADSDELEDAAETFAAYYIESGSVDFDLLEFSAMSIEHHV